MWRNYLLNAGPFVLPSLTITKGGGGWAKTLHQGQDCELLLKNYQTYTVSASDCFVLPKEKKTCYEGKLLFWNNLIGGLIRQTDTVHKCNYLRVEWFICSITVYRYLASIFISQITVWANDRELYVYQDSGSQHLQCCGPLQR